MASKHNSQRLIENLKAIIVRQTEIIDESKETIKNLRDELTQVKKELLKHKNISTSKTRMMRKRASVKKDIGSHIKKDMGDSGEESDSEGSDSDSSDSSDSDSSCEYDYYDYCSVTGKMFKC